MPDRARPRAVSSPLTQHWAALTGQQPVFVATFLVARKDNLTPEDYLGLAVSGLPCDVLGADTTRGSLISIRLRFFAPDMQTAVAWAEQAQSSAERSAHYTDSLVVRQGRATRLERT